MLNDHISTKVLDQCLYGEWFVIASLYEFDSYDSIQTIVDGQLLEICQVNEKFIIKFLNIQCTAKAQVEEAYGFIWLCLGTPKKNIFKLDEYHLNNSRIVPSGIYAVRTSPLRAVENFLDMAHFPYVHNGILGAEPETTVKPYHVEIRYDVDEIWATQCVFTQPQAAPNSTIPQETQYIYRILSPMNILLYKINTQGEGNLDADVICLFIQPISETQIRAHLLMILDDQHSPLTEMVLFQQKIFTQDKPILENHVPLKLPLKTHIEIPSKADAAAMLYRKWLVDKNWSYGAIQ